MPLGTGAGNRHVDLLHRHSVRFGSPQSKHDQAHGAEASVKCVCAPYVETDKHVGRDPDDSELEQPMQEHVECVAHAPDPRGKYLGAVEKLNGAQANRPADGIDEYAGYGSFGGPLVGISVADPYAHVDRHCSHLSRRAGNVVVQKERQARCD